VEGRFWPLIQTVYIYVLYSVYIYAILNSRTVIRVRIRRIFIFTAVYIRNVYNVWRIYIIIRFWPTLCILFRLVLRRSDGTPVRYEPSFLYKTAYFWSLVTVFYRLDGKMRYMYSTKPSWHCQCNFGLRMVSPPQHLAFPPPACSSHVLKPYNASLDDPEAGLGLHQLEGRTQQWLAWKLKVGRSAWFLVNN